MTYDDWIAGSGRTYAIRTTITPPGGDPVETVSSPVGLPQWLEGQRAGDFEDMAYFRQRPVHILPGNLYISETLTEASPSFLSVFNLIDDDRPLSEQDVLLSEAAAIRAFGRTDVIGETYDIPNIGTYRVRGVFTMPAKSHMQFDVVVLRSLESRQETRELGNWTSIDEYVYVRLGRGMDPQAVEARLNAALPDYLGPIVVRGTNLDPSDIWEITLTGVAKMNFLPPLLGQMKAPAHIFEIYFVAFLISFILLIMLTNLFNLSFLVVEDRAVELEMRRLHGESPLHQRFTLYLEMAALVTAMAMVAAVAVYTAGPFIERSWAMPQIWTMSFFDPSWLRTIAIVFAIGLGMAFLLALVGLYPSMFRKKGQTGKGGMVIRGVLLCLQVFAAGLIITSTVVLSRELDHQLAVDPGFDPDDMLMVRDAAASVGFSGRVEDIRAALLGADGVVDAVFSNAVPGEPFPVRINVAAADRADGPTAISAYHAVSASLPERFGARLLAGRFFDPNRPDDRFVDVDGTPVSGVGAALINRSFMKAFGYRTAGDALGKRLDLGDGRLVRIIGVIDDWPYQGINREYLPTVMVEDMQALGHLFIMGSDNLSAIHDALGMTVPTLNGHLEPFGPFWAEQFVNLKRATELGLFLSFIVMALVLVGLVSYLDFFIRKRTVELLIHQLHGAPFSQLFLIAGRVILIAVGLGSLAAIGLLYRLLPYATENGFASAAVGALPLISTAMIAIVILGTGWLSSLRILLRRDLYQALRSE